MQLCRDLHMSVVGDKPGSRSTYGVCQFALSWQIADGFADDVRLGHRHGPPCAPRASERSHVPRKWRIRADTYVSVSATTPVDADAPVTCWDVHERCGFATDFHYNSDALTP